MRQSPCVQRTWLRPFLSFALVLRPSPFVFHAPSMSWASERRTTRDEKGSHGRSHGIYICLSTYRTRRRRTTRTTSSSSSSPAPPTDDSTLHRLYLCTWISYEGTHYDRAYLRDPSKPRIFFFCFFFLSYFYPFPLYLVFLLDRG